MKKLVMMAVAGIAMMGVAFGQEQTVAKKEKSPEEIAAKQSTSLKEKLSLSDDQTAKVKTLISDNITKMRAVKAKYAAPSKEMGAEMKPLREDFKTRMKGILTAEQYTKWEQMKTEARAKHKHGHHGKHGLKDSAMTAESIAVKRSAALKEKLGLSDDQTAQVKTLITDNITQVRAVKAKYTGDKKGMGKELKPIKDAYNAKMKSILTPEQYTKWEQMKTDAKAKHKEKKQGRGKPDSGSLDDDAGLDF